MSKRLPRSKRPRGGRPYRRMAERLKREEHVCHICGNWIDPDLKSPDPMSFSVDHLQPVAMGGELLGPVRAAHRICNMKRGTGRGKPYTQGDRSAEW